MNKLPQSNLESLLEELLVEGRFEDAQAKYSDAANELAQLKAAGINSKYAQWFGKTWSSLEPQEQSDYSFEQIVELFKVYDQMLQKKLIQKPRQRDINSFSEWHEWVEFVGGLKQKAQQRDAEKERESDVEVVYKDNRYLIIKPNSEESSCKYGKNTKWCISADKDSDEENVFNKYTDRGVIFYFIIDRKTNDKDALAVHEQGRFEIYDSKDKAHNLTYLLDKYPEKLHQLIYKLAYKEYYEIFMASLENPIETLESFYGEADDFLATIYEKMPLEKQVAFLKKLLLQLPPTQPIPEKVDDFFSTMNDYTSYPSGAQFEDFNTLLHLLIPLEKTNPVFDEMITDLFGIAAGRLQFDIPDLQEYADFMGMLVPAIQEENYGDGGLMTQSLYSAIVNTDGKLLFELYQNYPKIFKNALENMLAYFPNFKGSDNFERLIGKIVGEQHGIPAKIAYKFTKTLEGIWDYLQSGSVNGNDDEFKRILNLLFKAAQSSKEEAEWAMKNSELFYHLVNKSKGNVYNLLPDDITSLQENSKRIAMKLIRKDMSRFLPELIVD